MQRSHLHRRSSFHHSPQQQHRSRARRIILAGVVAGVLVGLRLALIALWRSGADAFQHRVGLFNRRWTNRLTMTALRAGQHDSPYALIHHVGRRSGRAYATPVIIALRPDAFVIPLAYGQRVDWYRNIRAAGGCTIDWQGQTYRVGPPAALPAAQAISAFAGLWQWELRLYGITHFLQVPIIAAITPRTVAPISSSVAQDGRAIPTKRPVAPRAPLVPALSHYTAARATWATLDIWMRGAWDAWRTTRGGPKAIAARRSARFAELVAFARARSPYYRRLYQELPSFVGIDDLRHLPPTTKPELMAHFDDWVTDPTATRAGVETFLADLSNVGQLYLGRYLVWATSGTTGVPAILIQDQLSLVIPDMLQFVRMMTDQLTLPTLRRLLRHRGWSALICLTGGHFAGVSVAERMRRRNPWLANRARVFPVRAPLAELVCDLNTFDPAYLSGYASALVLLAQEQAAGRLHLHPNLVFSTAETLSAPARKRIQASFGCPVRDTYGASEAGALACECLQGRLHANTDWYIVEPVDETYQPVPVGHPSATVLVTNLANFVQPIIRYDLGDSITLSAEPCPCGSPLPVIHVEGRSGELLTFIAPNGSAVQLLPLALVTVVEETPGLRRCQLIQTAPATLTVRFEAQPASDAEQVWPAVQQRLCDYLAPRGLANVAIERAGEPPGGCDPRSGKLRQVWSEVARAGGTTPTGGRIH